MIVEQTPLAGVLVITPKVFRDSRGFFVETYQEERYRAAGITAHFTQDNHSSSNHATIRGLHAQSQRPQAKLLRCIEGAIWDVAVDVREGSPTFGKYFATELSADNYKQMYIAEGFVHGFAVLSEWAQVEYKCSDIYVADDQLAVRWNDPDLGIPWPVKTPLLSEKDMVAPLLKELRGKLPVFKA